MSIDIKSQEAIKKLKLVDLVNDAVERGDKAALEWLKKEANTLKKRTKADGTTYEVKKSIVEIRPRYLEKFLEYKPKGRSSSTASKERKKKEQQKALDDLFAAAFEKLGKK